MNQYIFNLDTDPIQLGIKSTYMVKDFFFKRSIYMQIESEPNFLIKMLYIYHCTDLYITIRQITNFAIIIR